MNRKRRQQSCSCAMANQLRFVEPLSLFLLYKHGPAHGYELLSQIENHVLTEAKIDGPGIYRTLRILEKNGHVVSSWEAGERGPARRRYSLTEKGKQHLKEWGDELKKLKNSLERFVNEIDKLKKQLSD